MSASFKVLVADRIAREGLAPLAADARFQLLEKPGLTGAALAEAMAEADAVLVRSATKITRESLARVTRLKVIGRAGVGVDTIDVKAATERGIAVMNAPAGNTISAAELAFAQVGLVEPCAGLLGEHPGDGLTVQVHQLVARAVQPHR